MTINPYESPLVDATLVGPESQDEAIRMAYLSHERAVKSIAVLHYFSVALLVLFGIAIASLEGHIAIRVASVIAFALLAAGYTALAVGIQRLRPWARIVSAIVVAPGILGVPLGTIIVLYVLYLLLSPKGAFVFSDQYAKVRAATPHLDKKLKTSLIVKIFAWILLAVLVLGLISAVVGSLFSP